MDAASPFLPASAPVALSFMVMTVLVAVIGLTALALWRGVAGDDAPAESAGKRFFVRLTVLAFIAELILVPLTLWQLAPAGLATRTYIACGGAMGTLLLALVLAIPELVKPSIGSGRVFPWVCGLFLATVIGLVSTKLIHKDEVTYAHQIEQLTADKD